LKLNKKPAENSLLSQIETSCQIRSLSHEQLQELAGEIRERIISVVAKNGGHLAPNLGVVELTIALHYVFDASYDRIIWDVGHQAYTHKLLSGRQAQFDTLRQLAGSSVSHSVARAADVDFDTGHAWHLDFSGALMMTWGA